MQHGRPLRGTRFGHQHHVTRRPVERSTCGTAALALSILFGATACVKTTTQSLLVSDGERPVLVSPKGDQSPLDVRVRYEQGLIRGHLEWSQRCRTGVESLSHDEVVEVKSANHGAGVVSLLIGGFISVVSAAVLANANTLSDVESCNTHSDGSTSCSSPQRDATALGLVGLGTGITFGGIGVATFGIRSTSTVIDSVDHPATLANVSKNTVPCGIGKVTGVGVALIRGMERLAATTTNAAGDFALVVPERMTGRMDVVIESVPTHISILRPNDLIANLDIPAVAESAAEATVGERPPDSSDPKAPLRSLPGGHQRRAIEAPVAAPKSANPGERSATLPASSSPCASPEMDPTSAAAGRGDR